jgi:hypothetical protein
MESPTAPKPADGPRFEDRCTHITIGLRQYFDGAWEPLRALGWNDVGFNFYSPHDLVDPVVQLKRGDTKFEGSIAWRSLNTSDDVIAATIVNEHLYAQTRVVHNDALQARLVKLIRAPMMVEEKRKLLASMGISISPNQLVEAVAQRKKDQQMYRYGVKVDAQAWRDIVKGALSVSSVVMSLEKFSDAFTKK